MKALHQIIHHYHASRFKHAWKQNHPCQNHTRAEPTNDAWKFARAKEEKGNEQEAPQLLMPLGRWSSTASLVTESGEREKGECLRTCSLPFRKLLVV